MEFMMKIPDSVFRTAKTMEQVAGEMRQAAALFWVARGDVAPEAIGAIVTPPPPETEVPVNGITAPPPEKQETLMDYLLSMPNVGEDADFERPLDYGRPVVEFD